MTTPLTEAALLCTAAGILAGLAVVLSTGEGKLALRVALELWLAAGLLRLAGTPSVSSIATAASILAVRQLVGLGLRVQGSFSGALVGERRKPRSRAQLNGESSGPGAS